MTWQPNTDTDVLGRHKASKHGTRSGYNRHRRHGEEACEACLAAEREYQRLHKRGYAQRRRAADRTKTS